MTAAGDWRQERDRALLVLESDQRPSVRTEAALLLCELAREPGRPAAEWVPALSRLLPDAQEEVRCAGVALAALVLSPEEAREVLVRRLSDPAPRVRVEAAGRLADLAEPTSRGVLAEAMRDQTFAVRFEAARGMAALRHSAGLEILVEALDQDELRFRALGALAELGDARALPAVRKVFRRWLLPGFERTQAAGAMARLGDAEGVRYLFRRTQRSWGIDRAMAIELLGELRAEGARQRLEQILLDRGDACRGAAARGLGRLGDLGALPALASLLEDALSSEDLRLDAAEGLCLLGAGEAFAKVEAAIASFPSAQTRAELRQMLAETRPGGLEAGR